MTTNPRRQDKSPPPPLDEGYWSALLNEGEYAEPVQRQREYPTDDAPAPTSVKPNNGYSEEVVADWDTIEDIMNDDLTVELVVVGYNRGGLLVAWRNIRGFVPASQLMDFKPNGNGNIRRNRLVERIGETLILRVIELNRDQNRLVLSERAARVAPGERANILERLEAGSVVTGDVTNITDFGAFVDLGGLEGLIHISELSWGRVAHPADMLHRGEQVRVYVLEVNEGAGRVALSLKRLHPDPWETVEHRYRIGEIVIGKVTNVVDFGAFACIEEGLEGLIHVSELAEGHFLHPRNVVEEGQDVKARILSIDRHARRLGLSLRSINQA